MGHTLLVPRVHVRDLWDLPVSEAHHLTAALLTLAPAVRRAFSPDGLNVVNSGEGRLPWSGRELSCRGS